MNKAELQLTKDVDTMMDFLAGIPPNQIVIRTLACFPEVPSSELQTIFCSSCLETVIVCQEDLSDLSLLQEKVQVLDKPNPATRDGMKSLLSLSAMCLSHQSILHVGYREVQDKANLVTERHRYNLEAVDSKMMQKEYVVASLPSAAAGYCQLHCLCNCKTPGAGGLGRHWQDLGGLAGGQQPHRICQ